jgi:hypothetical protein
VPQFVDRGAAGDEEAGDVPAAVADRVVEWGSDRAVWDFHVGAAVDERGRDVDVVAAGRPVQRRLGAWLGVSVVGVGAGRDEDGDDLRAVGEVARPVGHDVQRRAGLEATTQWASGELRIVGDDPFDCIDVAGVDGADQRGSFLVIGGHRCGSLIAVFVNLESLGRRLGVIDAPRCRRRSAIP